MLIGVQWVSGSWLDQLVSFIMLVREWYFISESPSWGRGPRWGFHKGFQDKISSLCSFCTQTTPFPPDGQRPVFDWQSSPQSSPRRWGPEGVTWRCGEIGPESHRDSRKTNQWGEQTQFMHFQFPVLKSGFVIFSRVTSFTGGCLKRNPDLSVACFTAMYKNHHCSAQL